VFTICKRETSLEPWAGAVQEWADYTSDALPWLEEDRELDAGSHHPGQHHFEKMTSGLYMGDLARRIILRCAGPAACACPALLRG